MDNITTDNIPIPAEPPTQPRAYYEIHIRFEKGMEQDLKDAMEIATLLADIPKASLTDLMNLFTNWGIEILKRKWYAKMGYK